MNTIAFNITNNTNNLPSIEVELLLEADNLEEITLKETMPLIEVEELESKLFQHVIKLEVKPMFEASYFKEVVLSKEEQANMAEWIKDCTDGGNRDGGWAFMLSTNEWLTSHLGDNAGHAYFMGTWLVSTEL